MRPRARRGALPQVSPCPYCGVNMNKTIMAKHRPICEQRHKSQPPQTPAYRPNTPVLQPIFPNIPAPPADTVFTPPVFPPANPPQTGTVSHPKPARLDQDPGGGYRLDGTLPQT